MPERTARRAASAAQRARQSERRCGARLPHGGLRSVSSGTTPLSPRPLPPRSVSGDGMRLRSRARFDPEGDHPAPDTLARV
eukprot:7309128-Prymnesium_polylepis.1